MPDHVCSIDGCGKPVRSRGWCGTHYMQWRRKGDPVYSERTKKGVPLEYISEIMRMDRKEECIPWPYNKNGNGAGVVWLDGRGQVVARVICEKKYGPPSSDRMQAAHSCGNGHLGCVNPSHLRWATPSENAADKLGHGTHNRGIRHNMAKLSEDDVHTIKSLIGVGRSQIDIADSYGVSQQLVSRIKVGKAWGWLT